MEVVKLHEVEMIISALVPEGQVYVVAPQDAKTVKAWIEQKEKEIEEEMIF